ncbi:hypothetical protein BO78DRAFT_387209 [Aspergillus sclerotiicarbonarius CBS 121057]|uniref:Uncharacterized protein n=1 Tax=Aspergillus sclerotiicarbonarius (strain CBS 121057 / IBT 28362) TaxID=1448318 RepID=A0A319EHE6_ASPSB|nr:hypothetical protein BO78DRAFT_387209 [Aspergillus sclerotiicarbonarius CBS 121057]
MGPFDWHSSLPAAPNAPVAAGHTDTAAVRKMWTLVSALWPTTNRGRDNLPANVLLNNGRCQLGLPPERVRDWPDFVKEIRVRYGMHLSTQPSRGVRVVDGPPPHLAGMEAPCVAVEAAEGKRALEDASAAAAVPAATADEILGMSSADCGLARDLKKSMTPAAAGESTEALVRHREGWVRKPVRWPDIWTTTIPAVDLLLPSCLFGGSLTPTTPRTGGNQETSSPWRLGTAYKNPTTEMIRDAIFEDVIADEKVPIEFP